MFKKGLINRDTFAMNYDQYIAALSNGTVIGMFDQGWDFGTATSALNDAKMYDCTYAWAASGPGGSWWDLPWRRRPSRSSGSTFSKTTRRTGS